MCGIVGYIGDQHKDCIGELMGEIAHRGPDDSGCYINGNMAFGFQRLSILDLTLNGHQPMFSADGNFLIVFNGEIYNHLDIREELIKERIQFKSESDTETLLNGYQVWGERILDKLNGIFAFAIYNIKEKEIFIARDQFGVKPLYYYYKEGTFLFGSEIKSFLNIPSFDKTIDAKGLMNYINFLWSPGTTTAFKDTKKLLPGHYLRFSINDIKIDPVKYYEIPFNGKYSNSTEEEIVNQLEEKLLCAVKRQLLSDVPVGFFLSGGLDSSLLVAMVRRLYPDKQIQTFTINTGVLAEEEGFANDLHYAKLVANHLKVDLEVVEAEVDIVKDFDKMIWHLDEPQADAAPLNVLNICKRAKEMGYKVMIGGAAGDDLFSGYRRHQALNYEKFFSLVPRGVGKFMKYFSGKLPIINARFRRLRKLIEDIDKTRLDRQAGYYSWLPLTINKSLFSESFQKMIGDYNPLDYLKCLSSNIPNEKNSLNQMLFWEMKTFLVDHNLNYTDKLSMAVGVEARVPYLDIELVKFSTTIPPELKMKGNETKYILKKVAERYLPKEVIYRSKSGFGAPLREWVTHNLDDKIKSYLSEESLNKRGIFNPDAVWKIIEDNKHSKIDASYIIWDLLAIESWMRQFVDKKK
ncbi:MAG: asparagine synthase (glutamine-hydrolyzing) [Bacteroidota bacterium]|nr:asparagine synthase (glutamine-hydrolyzing) [Bacteroidota bacterium]